MKALRVNEAITDWEGARRERVKLEKKGCFVLAKEIGKDLPGKTLTGRQM